MSIYEWAQRRLFLHGLLAETDIDGVWGPKSTNAIKQFQSRHRLPQTGTLAEGTVALLRATPGSPLAQVASPTEKMPPWMHEMYRRMGLHETRDNTVLSTWLRIGRYLGDPAKLPWCGDAIETCIVKTLPNEPVPNNPFWAQSWAQFGVNAGAPVVGSIGVIRWTASSGHVGIVAGVNGSNINLLGGNQSNEINIRSFPRSKFIAFRWPVSYPIKQYPPLRGSAPASSLEGTR